MKRIICIGNVLVTEDRAGFDVFQRLRSMPLPPDVEVIDGGLAGLDLLRLVDGADHIVFVDSVADDDIEDGLVVWDAEQVVSACNSEHYGHGAGLPYLLKMLPAVAEHAVPPIQVVGLAPGYSDRTCRQAATLCLLLVGASVARDGGHA
jgi:hydrogenase maturation protease